MKVGNVYLRPLMTSDANFIVKWRNNEEVIKNLFSQDLITLESHAEYYKQQIETKKCYQFIVEQIIREDGGDNCSIPIGTVYLKNVDVRNRKALLGIFIGEGIDRGRGFGKEATELIVKYGFNTLNLHKIYLQIIADNGVAISLYKNLGFVEEGCMRQDYYRNGKYYDVIQMSMLKEDASRFLDE